MCITDFVFDVNGQIMTSEVLCASFNVEAAAALRRLSCMGSTGQQAEHLLASWPRNLSGYFVGGQEQNPGRMPSRPVIRPEATPNHRSTALPTKDYQDGIHHEDLCPLH